MERKEHLIDVIRVFFRWKFFILGVCLIVGIGSIVLSLMMDNYYQSTTTFYATNYDLARPNPIGSIGINRNYYGSGEDIDRIMTLAESGVVAEYVIEKFGLFEHYSVNKNDKKARFRIREAFNSRYKVIQTKYDAIEIMVEDTDPKMAQKIADAAREKVASLSQNIIRQSQIQQIEMMRSNIEGRKVIINTIEDTLLNIRRQSGIINASTQSRDLPELLLIKNAKKLEEEGRLEELKKFPQIPADTIIYSQARIRGLEKEIKGLKKQLNDFTNGFSSSEIIYRQHQINADELAFESQRLQQMEAVYQSDFATIHVVEEATVPLDKSRPKRSIIVILSVLMAFVLSSIAAVIFETYKSINWRQVLHG